LIYIVETTRRRKDLVRAIIQSMDGDEIRLGCDEEWPVQTAALVKERVERKLQALGKDVLVSLSFKDRTPTQNRRPVPPAPYPHTSPAHVPADDL
jgi:hypothetical protein